MSIKEKIITATLLIPVIALTVSTGQNIYERVQQKLQREIELNIPLQKPITDRLEIITEDELDKFILGPDYQMPTNNPILYEQEKNYDTPTNTPKINYPRLVKKDIWC